MKKKFEKAMQLVKEANLAGWMKQSGISGPA